MGKEAGEVIREWLTEKLGNPVMTSRKKDVIKELEDEERKSEERSRALQELQERGEDYPAKIHTR